MITCIFAVTDLNFRVFCGHSDQEGMAHKQRQNRLRATVRAYPHERLPKGCPQVPGRVQGPEVLLSRSISLHGLRATDLPGESARIVGGVGNPWVFDRRHVLAGSVRGGVVNDHDKGILSLAESDGKSFFHKFYAVSRGNKDADHCFVIGHFSERFRKTAV